MADTGADASLVKRQGWRQGSVVPPTLIASLCQAKLMPTDLGPQDLLMVISHDCDVNHGDYESEPHAELVIFRARVADQRQGSYFWGNNPRRYQIEDHGMLYELFVHERCTIPRRVLADGEPDRTRVLGAETVRRICRWMGSRYFRASFPDAFNDRTAPAIKALWTKFKKRGEFLSGIYVMLSTEDELPSDQPYSIAVRATMTVEMYGDPEKREQAENLVQDIEAALLKCTGIKLDDLRLVSEGAMSLDDLRYLKRWDFDTLSLRTETVDTLSPAP